jgi:hypothetical protein
VPISKNMLARYPENWREISDSIRFGRAKGKCEKKGCEAVHLQPHPLTGSRVILATAHLNHIPEDNRPGNLMAMCQRCHLLYDWWYHRACKKTGDLIGYVEKSNKNINYFVINHHIAIYLAFGGFKNTNTIRS